MTNLMMFLGGVALFLYGTTIMSDYLKKANGNKLKTIIEKVVDNPLSAVLIGILSTAISGSSSAIIILIIGLVRAEIINSKQSVGLIMGANIGTTVSSFIISLPISEYSYLMLFIGVIFMFLKSRRIRNIGGVLVGVSLLFVGLNIMSEGVKPIIENGFANKYFNETKLGTITGLLFGTIFTSIIQSSSATIAIVQKLYALNIQIESITLKASLPILIGANIGTTITGILASIGGNSESKKAALTHIIINIFVALLFISLISPFSKFMIYFESKLLTNYSIATLAFANLFMNLGAVIILFFFTNQIVKLVDILVKDKESKTKFVFDDKIIEQAPTVALDLSRRAIKYLSNLVYEYFILTKEYSFEYNEDSSNTSNEYEKEIDELNGNIHNYLIKIIRKGVNRDDINELSSLLDITKDLERIGDHLTNIIEFFNIRYKEGHDLSNDAIKELNNLYNVLNEMMLEILKSIDYDFTYIPKNIDELEELVDKLEQQARDNYGMRLKEGLFDFYQTSNYTDIISDLERIGDHLYNINNAIVDPMFEKTEITGLKIKGVK